MRMHPLRRVALIVAAMGGTLAGVVYLFAMAVFVLLGFFYVLGCLVFNLPSIVWNAAAGKGPE